MKLIHLIGGFAAVFVLIAAVAYATSGFTACPILRAGESIPAVDASGLSQAPATGCCGMRSAAAPVAPRIDGKQQTLCPIMGGPINKKLFVDVLGKRIYICCPGCTEAIRSNPEAALKKIAENGEEAQTLAQ